MRLRCLLLACSFLPLTAPAQVLEEVIVTAQRREQSLQDVAVAVDAISYEALRRSGVESVLDLGQISPSLGLSGGGGPLTSVFIRGVGANTVNPLFDAGVAQNYDGVYLARPNVAMGLAFYDMERLEILKGPQGTLYGRNATGGVINYIPVRPELGETSGYAQAEFGNYSRLGFEGAVNFPVGDTAAFRISGSFLDRDGFSDDGTNDADTWSLRAQGLFEPSDRLSVRIALDLTENDAKGGHGDIIGNYSTIPGTLLDFTPSGIPVFSGPTSAAGNALRTSVLHAPSFSFFRPVDSSELFMDLEYSGVLAEINYTTDYGTLTVVPAYRDSTEDYAFTGPAFAPSPTTQTNEQSSFEARFATELDGAVNGVFGVFYFDEEVEFSANFNQEYVAPIQNFNNGGDSWAVFANATFDVSDSFRINAGVRYTEDSKFVNGTNHTYILFCGGPPGGGFITPPASFGAGCQNQTQFPATSNPQTFIDGLVADGVIPPGSTPDDGFYPVINGIPGAIIDVDGPGGLSLVNTIDDSEVTYRAGFEWDVGPENLLYLNLEHGYRAGGVDISQVVPTYPPEFIDALTIGSKNRFSDNSVQLNVEVFYWEYTDQQINYFSTINGAPDFPTASADSTILGIDVDTLWAVGDRTTIGFKAQYLDSTYDSLTLVSDPGGGRYGCGQTGVNGAGLAEYSCAGQRLAYAPEFGADFNINHIFNVGDFELLASADMQYRSEQTTDNSFIPETVADDYLTLNLGATLSPNNGNWSLTGYVRNATDEEYIVTTQVSSSGLAHAIFNPPRTVGARIRIDF